MSPPPWQPRSSPRCWCSTTPGEKGVAEPKPHVYHTDYTPLKNVPFAKVKKFPTLKFSDAMQTIQGGLAGLFSVDWPHLRCSGRRLASIYLRVPTKVKPILWFFNCHFRETARFCEEAGVLIVVCWWLFVVCWCLLLFADVCCCLLMFVVAVVLSIDFSKTDCFTCKKKVWKIQTSEEKNNAFILLAIAGVITLPTQTMHFYRANPSKLPYMCCLLPRTGDLMTPEISHIQMAGCLQIWGHKKLPTSFPARRYWASTANKFLKSGS